MRVIRAIINQIETIAVLCQIIEMEIQILRRTMYANLTFCRQQKKVICKNETSWRYDPL